jgi:hypothetical protein
MPKTLCYSGMAVSGLVLALFGLDMATSVPFHRVSGMMDTAFTVCAVLLAHMGWSTLHEQV